MKPRHVGELLSEELVLVPMQRSVLVLRLTELRSLLARDPVTWARALRRGKVWKRARALAVREAKRRVAA
jgi:hypothetical protein